MTQTIVTASPTGDPDPAGAVPAGGADPVGPRSPGVPGRGNRLRMLVVVTAASLAWATVCNIVLELLHGGGVRRLLGYVLDEAGLIFLLSSGVLWLLLAGMVALTGRFSLPAGLLLAAVTLGGFADRTKLQLRREPLYPSDLAFAGQTGFLSQMVGAGTVALVVLVLAAEIAAVVLVGRLVARAYPPVRRRREPRRWAAFLAVRLVVLALVTGSLAYLHGFNEPGNRVRALYERAGVHWAFWFQEVNYHRNGFVAGFLYNLNVPAMTEPEGYGPETMAAIADRYAAAAGRINGRATRGALDDVNVVVVLSEAFTDPTRVEGVSLDEDPIPFTRSLMASTTSGDMLAQMFGGGTANMEFEVLTSMSLSQFLPQMNTPYQMLVPKTPDFPSSVEYLRALGHDAIGVHPYMTTMYKRYEVYPKLGFSELVGEDHLAAAQRIDRNDFISDASAFEEVERRLAASDGPLLVNLVTMQNHYPMEGKYDDPVGVGGVTGDVAEQLGHYARGLRHSDDALRDFLGALDRSREPTAVVFYGDHAPAFWDGEVVDRNGELAFRRTPFFLWSNVGDLPSRTEPLTSPIYFLPLLHRLLGAPVPPYYALLLELHEEIPAMEKGDYFGPDGERMDESELSPRARRLLEDYRLVQYDLAVGERYTRDRLLAPPPG